MKVHMHPERRARRGDPVEVGNVYTARSMKDYSLVVAVIKLETGKSRPWNNVVCLRVNAVGDIVGAEKVPERYCSEHRDLVGKAEKMPDFSIKWINDGGNKT